MDKGKAQGAAQLKLVDSPVKWSWNFVISSSRSRSPLEVSALRLLLKTKESFKRKWNVIFHLLPFSAFLPSNLNRHEKPDVAGHFSINDT